MQTIDSTLIQILVGRLWHSKQETIKDLCLLWEAGGEPFDCFHFPSRIQGCENYFEARNILGVISYAVSGFSGLNSKSNRVQNEEGLSEVTKDGLQLLLEILTKWMQIPFRTPKYFFNLRYAATLTILTRNSCVFLSLFRGLLYEVPYVLFEHFSSSCKEKSDTI